MGLRDVRDRWRSRTLGGLWALAAGGCLLAAAPIAASAAEPAGADSTQTAASQPGVWQAHRMTFYYLGIDPKYSCYGLSDQLELLLKRSGARMDGPVIPGACVRGYGTPGPFPNAQLKFSTLKPVAGTANPDATMAGAWHHVLLAPNHPAPYLRGGDCELVQEFKDKVLPMFTTRNVKANLECVPYQTTGYFFSLSFDVFEPGKAPPG